ncbi:HlyC/CorC family transporter [Dichotomicrobium thermohalophilum]|uniref:Mg2+/Co2+ transporter CorB n=1 Tax=Dichotomicrobium thermohalophilum TaxID=933063 RepID=A0A397QCS0_9HYPH|nr:HlyC/CorC family transporter [Dichotomicrobium thermohalophilum]RIA55884.1 Mg2+/Co2+ transporter CorB [Dichotomicrobium thermohalophilum]
MTLGLLLTTAAIIGLLFLSGFFSGSETALTATSRGRMHALEKEGDKRAKAVNQLVERRERFLGAILLGNNLVNILGSALATSLFLQLFGQAGVAYATLVMTALVVIFAEVMPKTYAIGNPDRFALATAPILTVVVRLFSPVTAGVQVLVSRMLTFITRHQAEDHFSPRQEIRGAIDLHHRAGRVVKFDRDMLGGVLDLPDLTVSDIMVHRTKMETINADEPPEQLVENVLHSPHTRLPIWQDDLDNIVGIVHAKALLRAVQQAQGDMSRIDILSVAAEPWFVPETTSLKDQLNAFLRKKAHFALVVDEFGEVMGLVTLEDILEEIVGEISDELDVTVTGIRPQPDGSLIVDGTVPIRDLNRLRDWELPDEEATTIAGLVIHEAETIPDEGQVFRFHGFRFEIIKRQRNRITQLRISPVKTARLREA